MMTSEDTARYQFDYAVTLDEYADFNVYAGVYSTRSKKILRKRRALYWVYLLLTLALAGRHLFLKGLAEWHTAPSFALLLFAAVFSAVILTLLSPPFLRKRVRRLAISIAKKEESVYTKKTTLSFYDRFIHEKSERKEERIQYDKIVRYHIGPNAIYLYTTISTAYILPRHVINPAEESAFLDFLQEKLPPQCRE